VSRPEGPTSTVAPGDLAVTPPLVYARSIAYPPGSNLKGQLAGATWAWLLPSPTLGRVAIAGDVTAAARAALAGIATEIRPAGEGSATAPWEPDVAWVHDPAGRAGPTRPVAIGSEAVLVYDGPAQALRASMIGDGIRPTSIYAIRPARGEVRSAVPADDPDASAWLARRNLLGPAVVIGGSGRGRAAGLWRRVRTRASSRSIAVRPVPERVIALMGPTAPAPGPPRYLRALAESAGIDLDGWRFALAAPGVYNTQKLLLWLWPPGEEDPAIVVKATRDAVATPRLENERFGLDRLAALGDLTAGRTPRVRFAGRLSERALVGEEVLDGRSLRALGPLSPGDARVEDALGWLTDLAVRTARPVAGPVVAEAVADLANRWSTATQPPPALAARIRSDVAAVRESSVPIPVVYQHGDPGTWNLFAGADGLTRFLDWENFDPGGLPLWDVMYLVRSVVADGLGRGPLGNLRRGGRAGRVSAGYVAALRSDPAVTRAIERYCALVGLGRTLVGPLARLGWMHQALKEATRLPAGEGGRSSSQATLRASMDL